MRKQETIGFIMIWLLGLYVSLPAQDWLYNTDYQLMRNEIMAAKTFHTTSWVMTACGNDYMLKELMRSRIDALLLLNRHAFLSHVSHNGYSKYGELISSLGYAMKFGRKVAVGLRFHYFFQHVEDYEAQHSFTFDVSMYAQLSKKLFFGFEVYNPARLRYSIRGPDIIPMRFTVITHYVYSDKLLFIVQVLKCLPGRFDVSAGCCYRPLQYFYLSFACSLFDLVFGLMFRCRRFYFTVDTRYNYRLGFAPEVGVLVQLGKKG